MCIYKRKQNILFITCYYCVVVNAIEPHLLNLNHGFELAVSLGKCYCQMDNYVYIMKASRLTKQYHMHVSFNRCLSFCITHGRFCVCCHCRWTVAVTAVAAQRSMSSKF